MIPREPDDPSARATASDAPASAPEAASAGAAELADELDDSVVDKTVHALEKLGLEFATSTNPKLEKLGLSLFAKHEARYPPLPGTEVVHLLDDDERENIRRLARRMTLWAFFVGACSGLVSSIASFVLSVPEGTETTFARDVLDFLIVNGVTIGATAIEVAILYRVALKTVHLLAREAGISLVPRDGVPDTDERRAVALAMARSALELPNPPQNPFGIDPYKEVSKWRVVFVTLFYKLKISLTNFILRLLIRRVGGRVIVKAYLTFTDVLVTGAWDALVAWRMMRQARIRALGPSACEALLIDILRDEKRVRKEVLAAMLRAVASCIVRNHEVHPNLLALCRSVIRRLGTASVPELDDTKAFIAALDGLTPHERDLVLEVLVLATFPDGHVSKAEVTLLHGILSRHGRTLDVGALKRVCKRFVHGDALHRDQLRAVLGLGAA